MKDAQDVEGQFLKLKKLSVKEDHSIGNGVTVNIEFLQFVCFRKCATCHLCSKVLERGKLCAGHGNDMEVYCQGCYIIRHVKHFYGMSDNFQK